MPQPLSFLLALLCTAVSCAVKTEKSTDTLGVDALSPVTVRADDSTWFQSRLDSKDPRVAAIARAESVRQVQIAKGDTLRFAGMTLSEYGIGPLRIGMTVAEAAAALGGGFADSDIGNPPDCTQAVVTRAPPGFGVHLENGKVAEIYAEGGSIAAASGVRIGDPVTKIRPLYPGSRIVRYQNRDTDDAYGLSVTPGTDTTSPYRIVFQTDGKVVIGISAGVIPTVEYSEGCA